MEEGGPVYPIRRTHPLMRELLFMPEDEEPAQ
jgi:hypothetical protein